MKETIFYKKGNLKIIISSPGYLIKKKNNDIQRWQYLPLGVVLGIYGGTIIF